MPLPVIADVFRVVLNWSADSTPGTAHNVMHFLSPTLDSDGVFAALDGSVAVAMWDWVSTNANVDSVDVTPLDGSTATTTYSTAGNLAAWSGGGLGTPLPQVAGIVKFATALRGRRNRGRVYLPYVGEGEVVVNQLIDVAAVEAAWVAFLNDMVAANAPLVIASYVGVNAHQVVNINAEETTATQRRRNQRPS